VTALRNQTRDPEAAISFVLIPYHIFSTPPAFCKPSKVAFDQDLPPGSATSRYGTMSSTILKSAKKTSYGQQVANRQRSENIYFPDALGSKRGEYGRVRAVVAQLSGGNRNFGSRMSLHPIRRKPRRMGTPLSGAQEFNPRVAGR